MAGILRYANVPSNANLVSEALARFRSPQGDYPGPIGPPIRRRALSTWLKAGRSCLTALTIGTVPI